MTFSITFFLISLLSISALIANKFREIEKGEAYFSFHRGVDDVLHKLLRKFKTFIKYAPKQMGRALLYFIVHQGVALSEKIKSKMHPRLLHMINTVKGKYHHDNNGNSSFFLKRMSHDLKDKKK